MNPIEITNEEFRKLVDQVSNIAAEYLDHLDSRLIAPTTNGAETLRIFRTPVPEIGMGQQALTDLHEVVRLCRAQNGRFFG